MSTSHSRSVLMVASVLLGGLLALASLAQTASRGELLYTTYCQACHATQVHWRTNKQAHDWASLNLEVRRWQASGTLDWSDADIQDVTHYLNDRFYHFAKPAMPVSAPPSSALQIAL
jgi:mono/diheme cytochrome c family protein